MAVRSQRVMGMEGSGWSGLFWPVSGVVLALLFQSLPAGGSGGGDSMIRVENFFLIEINVCAR